MTTPILGIPELADGQISQFATANEAFRALESASNAKLTVNLSSADATLTSAEFASAVVFQSTGNTVARDLVIPATTRLFAVRNGGIVSLDVVRGTTALAVDAGELKLFYADGTSNGLAAIMGAGSGGSGGGVSPVTEPGTSRGLTTEDTDAYIRCTSASAVSVTVPTNASQPFIIGAEVHVRQAGGGAVTIVAESGVTINPPVGGTLVLAGLGATATLLKVAENEWDLMGLVEASS